MTLSNVFRLLKKADNEDDLTLESVRKIHEITNHKQMGNMMYIYRNAGKEEKTAKKLIEKVLNSCKICQTNKKTPSRPKIAFSKGSLKASSDTSKLPSPTFISDTRTNNQIKGKYLP